MGFKENLKEELTYQGMLVKELATLSGLKKKTIDNYLNTHNCMPSADAAVRIARALDVSVEYLVLGSKTSCEKTTTLFKPKIRDLLQVAEKLDDYSLNAVLTVAQSILTIKET